MASINSYSAQLTVSLLDNVTTVMATPGSQETGSVNEAAGGFPQKIAASASDVNVKLGSLADPVLLALWGDEGVSFKKSQSGDTLAAYPFACLSDISNGLGISEIWVSNGVASEQTYTFLAVE